MSNILPRSSHLRKKPPPPSLVTLAACVSFTVILIFLMAEAIYIYALFVLHVLKKPVKLRMEELNFRVLCLCARSVAAEHFVVENFIVTLNSFSTTTHLPLR